MDLKSVNGGKGKFREFSLIVYQFSSDKPLGNEVKISGDTYEKSKNIQKAHSKERLIKI